jgi:hypothetical protein
VLSGTIGFVNFVNCGTVLAGRKSMRRLGIIVLIGLAALVAAAAAFGYGSWHVLGRGSASGEFAAAAANGTAKRPHQMAVRLSGTGVSGFVAVACTKAFGIGSKTTNYTGAGLHLLRLPMKNADRCSATASVSGSGHVVVTILAR